MAVSSFALLPLATMMDLLPHEGIALATVITVAARKTGLSEAAMVSEALSNGPLRDYLAGACRKAMTEVLQ